MEVKTRQHWKNLIEIFKEDGFLTALDYDYQITRARHPLFNWFMEDVEYLKTPYMSDIKGSPARDDCIRIHHSKYYTTTYKGGWGRERLVNLQLK